MLSVALAAGCPSAVMTVEKASGGKPRRCFGVGDEVDVQRLCRDAKVEAALFSAPSGAVGDVRGEMEVGEVVDLTVVVQVLFIGAEVHVGCEASVRAEFAGVYSAFFDVVFLLLEVPLAVGFTHDADAAV